MIGQLIDTIKSIYQTLPAGRQTDTKIVEIGGGLGYITEHLIEHFDDVDCVELDDELFGVLNKKFVHNKNLAYLKEKSTKSNKIFIHNPKSENRNSKTTKKSIIYVQ